MAETESEGLHGHIQEAFVYFAHRYCVLTLGELPRVSITGGPHEKLVNNVTLPISNRQTQWESLRKFPKMRMCYIR